MPEIGRVEELWRYPVKGLLGERLPALDLDGRGVVGDRRFAVYGADGKMGSAKTTRRFRRMPNLLSMTSMTRDDGSVAVEVGDGARYDVGVGEAAVAVGRVVGEDVTLGEEEAVSHFDDAPVHILTTSSLAWLRARLPDVTVDRRRFRPNIVVGGAGAGLVEEQWVGEELLIGDVRLRIDDRVIRCVTTTLAQQDLEFAPGVLKALERSNDLCLGVYASVVVPGRVERGAPVVRVGGAIPTG